MCDELRRPSRTAEAPPEARPIRYCPRRTRSGSDRPVGRSFQRPTRRSAKRCCSSAAAARPPLSACGRLRLQNFGPRLHPRVRFTAGSQGSHTEKKAHQTAGLYARMLTRKRVLLEWYSCFLELGLSPVDKRNRGLLAPF